jgi:hypothetical protein
MRSDPSGGRHRRINLRESTAVGATEGPITAAVALYDHGETLTLVGWACDLNGRRNS